MPILTVPPLIHCDDWHTLNIMEQWEKEDTSLAVSTFIELAWQQDKTISRFEAEQIINTYYEKHFK